ncbi:hypothetical protein CYMTET_50443 [Cymbomonas tetramitiformis]|uniref:Reverse transcriptase Ty1/copia-type domain-containing protein n=1 Tax=Cymbomonas tetramitiformis TaxID=36881 RepID=A0AAE0EUR8_9CHLO|nr:hypothetical protein CYMTET_50443 [Cymbomonas tetramitiformis]
MDVKKAIVPVETVPGGVKQQGVHYEDVYAPRTQLSTLRILIQLRLVLWILGFSLDVITCFLNGELDVDEPMSVSWPNGLTMRGVFFGKLQKSVYGLKQAPRIWYRTSKKSLLAYDHRLRVSDDIDPCLFCIW